MAVFGLLSLQVLMQRQFARESGQHQHGVGCQGKPCGCDCPSQLWKSLFSISEPLQPLKSLLMFIYWAIKRYEELWRVEDRADTAQSGRLKSVRAQATIKTVREQIHRNLLWKQMIMS